MKAKNFGFLILPAVLCSLSSCLSDDEKRDRDYSEWKTRNVDYFNKCKEATTDGMKQYVETSPKWDKSMTILMKWHNDRALTEGNLTPMDNSTVDIKYILTTIDGDTIDSSYSQTAHGDSIYRCQPNQMITGFQAALTTMHKGDSVTAVIPYTAGYGVVGSGSVAPYSTLVFGIKLVDIDAWEKPSWRE